MRAPSVVLIVAVASMSALAPPRPAAASSPQYLCPPKNQPLAAWYEQADAIFVGSVLEVSKVPVAAPQGAPSGPRHVDYATRFRVDERFKGELGGEVTILGESVWSNCVVEFDVGERYVVFAFLRGLGRRMEPGERAAPDAALRSDHNSPTARVAARADVLAYLRIRAATGRAPDLVGVVYDSTPRSLQEQHLPTHLGWIGVTTRTGVTVTLTGGDRTLTAVTDADGGFAFERVPEGDYSIGLDLPAGVRLLTGHAEAPGLFLRNPGNATRVQIRAGATAARYFTVTGSASVSGRVVFPPGAPGTPAYAHLVLASEPGRPEVAAGPVAQFDGAGRFEFDLVPPGEYVLVFNAGREEAFDGRGPTFYHPGVTDPAAATRLRISDGASLELGDLKPPSVEAVRPLDVTVLDEAGRGRQADLRCVVEPGGKELSFMTDTAGRVRLYLRAGIRFRIEVAGSDDPRADGPVEIGAEGTPAPVKFVIPFEPPEDAKP